MSALTDSLDVTAAELRKAFIAAQQNFLSVHGRFWQGTITHGDIPADGEALPIEDLDGKPVSEPFGWRAFAPILPSDLRAALVVDNYDGPQGKGFLVHVVVREDGHTLRRTFNHGPEQWRETGWTDVSPIQ